MAQSQSNASWSARDDEVRESLRVIRRERNTKVVVAIGAIIVAILAAFVFTYLAYSDEFDATKTPPTQPSP